MKTRRLFIKTGLAAGALLVGAQMAMAQIVPLDANGFMVAKPEAMLPKEGSRTVNVLGNPSEPGLYVVRITFPAGQGSRPHFHSQARYITVMKGTWYVSSGPGSDVYNPDQMTAVPAGTFLYQPPNGHHYDMAKDEEVTVQIMGMGPVETTQIAQP